jgi:phosphotransferase system HPr-like phosphotransfer protein
MWEFDIAIRSFHQVKEFVTLAMVQPFEVLVGNDGQQINGKSFIGMFSLNYSRPVHVRVKCTDEEYRRFRQQASKFLA